MPAGGRDLIRREVELLKADIQSSEGRIGLLKQLRENYRKAGADEAGDAGATTNTTRALLHKMFPPDRIYDMLAEEYADPLLSEAEAQGGALSAMNNQDHGASARMFRRFRYTAPAEGGSGPKNYQSIVVDGYVILLEYALSDSVSAAVNSINIKVFTPGGSEVKHVSAADAALLSSDSSEQ